MERQEIGGFICSALEMMFRKMNIWGVGLVHSWAPGWCLPPQKHFLVLPGMPLDFQPSWMLFQGVIPPCTVTLLPHMQTQLGQNSPLVSTVQPQMCLFIISMRKSQKENLGFQVFGKAKYLFCVVRVIFPPCKALKWKPQTEKKKKKKRKKKKVSVWCG